MQDEKPGGDINATAEDDSVRAALEAAFEGYESDTGSVAEKAPAEDKAEKLTDPLQEAEKPADGRVRDEKGRFVAKDDRLTENAQTPSDPAKLASAQVQPDNLATQPQDAQQPQQDQAVEGKPPPGWSVKSKAEWDSLPPHIRADVIKREQEVNNGFAKLGEYKAIDRYMDMAKRSGTTLDVALKIGRAHV